MASHETIVFNFASRQINTRTGGVDWKGHNVSCNSKVINSYHHWPMAYYLADELFLKQGDTYSVSTSTHQRYVQQECTGPTVSFSALVAANIAPESLTVESIVDYQPDKQIDLERVDKDSPWTLLGGTPFKQPSQGMLITYKSHQGWSGTGYWHILGGCLIQHGGKQYLCSIDENSYFISQLSKQVQTVEQAFESLKPKEVQYAEEVGWPVQRQGEWFFVNKFEDDKHVAKEHNWTIKELRGIYSKIGALPRKTEDSNAHTCRYLSLFHDTILATGCVKHPDHHMLKLGKTWWRAYRNTEVQSWSRSGKFD